MMKIVSLCSHWGEVSLSVPPSERLAMFTEMVRDPAVLVITATILAACSGVPGLFLRHGPLGQRLATAGALAAAPKRSGQGG